MRSDPRKLWFNVLEWLVLAALLGGAVYQFVIR